VGWTHGFGVMAAVVLLDGTSSPIEAELIPGGGPSATDCYVELDVAGASGSNKLACVDGDPSCDVDGQCQGTCTFEIAVCLNQTNVAGCTPAAPSKPLTVKGATLVVPASSDASAVCGAPSEVAVALKGKRRKRGKKKLRVTAVVAGKPAKDTDRLLLRCAPREGACPTTTTTIATTTTTTLPPALDAHALLVGSRLLAFSSADPSVVDTPVEMTGLFNGDALVSIDRRPVNGILYGLGFNAGAGTVQLYALHPSTGLAVPVGSTGTFVDGGGSPVTIGDGIGTRFGIDVNPVTDRIRVVDDTGQSFRIDPNRGTFVDGNLGVGVVTGLNMDAPINGTTSTVEAAGYTNVGIVGAITTLYTMDSSIDALCIQSPPNGGTQTVCKALGADVDAVLGFDVPPAVDAPALNEVASGQGVAVVRPAGQPAEFLAPVDLATGALGTMSPIATTDVLGIALQKPASVPIVGILDTGALVRFTSDAPSETATGVVLLPAGEELVGLDFRPQTGELFGLAIDAATNAGTLYRLDPFAATASLVGGIGAIAFVDGAAAPVDFPSPSAGWGIDFNPAVDRIRVVSGFGLNFRVNPNTGAPVDGNLGGVSIVTGTNPDGPINGATTSAHETAYTNSVGQNLTGGVTTVYTLDAVTDALHLQTPPNTGTQTGTLPITLGGAPLDFTATCGFDIPSDVATETSNVPVTTGSGYAALTVGGTTSLYRIDLATGVATDLGAIGDGNASLRGITVGRTTLQ
jgi:hypothetical protein